VRRPPGPYQLQAAIASVHAESGDGAATDWASIATLYDRLIDVLPTPVVALNRAAAHGMAFGPQAGLRLLEAPALRDALSTHHLYHSARADLLRRGGRNAEALIAYAQALLLVGNESERHYLERRRLEVLANTPPAGG
jgi:RNA polymerase sigma-70 factor (ECF subfamily)